MSKSISFVCLNVIAPSWVMMCCSKTSKLGRKRQEPSSRSKMSLCHLFCNNSYKVMTAALKNFLWHRRDENADTEVIGLSRWIYCIHLRRHKLSPAFDHIAHHTMQDPSLNGPVAVSSSGTGTVTVRVSPPHVLTWPNPTPMVSWQNWKANISAVKKSLASISSY